MRIEPRSGRYDSAYDDYRDYLVVNFYKRFPPDCCLLFNYTYGFCEEVEAWCDEHDPGGWVLLEDYGWDWPIGFSHPDLAFAFKMRWSDGLC